MFRVACLANIGSHVFREAKPNLQMDDFAKMVFGREARRPPKAKIKMNDEKKGSAKMAAKVRAAGGEGAKH